MRGGRGVVSEHGSCSEPRFLSEAAAMESVGGSLARSATTDVRVVLYGEAGTGKSFAASTLHRLSHRRHNVLRRLSVRDPSAVTLLAEPEYLKDLDGGTLVLEGVDEDRLWTYRLLGHS